MFRHLPLPVVIILAWFAASGFQADPEKKMALTFERLPAMGPFGFWRPREVSRSILRVLEKEKITAAGFVMGEKVELSPVTYVILEDWAEGGHILGNLAYTNTDLNQLSADDFLDYVKQGEKYLRPVSRSSRSKYRYLRFPLLHYGETQSKKRRVLRVLQRADYEVVHVTVKTSDYRFNPIYLESERDPEALAKLREIFLKHCFEMLEYSEDQSQAVFGQQITQIFQLRAGVATAAFLGDLIEGLRERGYTFVALDAALKDPLYQSEETYVGPAGLTFIDRVAATLGLPFEPELGELSNRDARALFEDGN